MVVCACDVFAKLRHKNLCGVSGLARALSGTAHHPSQQYWRGEGKIPKELSSCDLHFHLPGYKPEKELLSRDCPCPGCSLHQWHSKQEVVKALAGCPHRLATVKEAWLFQVSLLCILTCRLSVDKFSPYLHTAGCPPVSFKSSVDHTAVLHLL